MDEDEDADLTRDDDAEDDDYTDGDDSAWPRPETSAAPSTTSTTTTSTTTTTTVGCSDLAVQVLEVGRAAQIRLNSDYLQIGKIIKNVVMFI